MTQTESYVVQKSGFISWSIIVLCIFGFPFFAFVIGKISGAVFFHPIVNLCPVKVENEHVRQLAGPGDGPTKLENVEPGALGNQDPDVDLKRDGSNDPKINRSCEPKYLAQQSTAYIGLNWLAIASCAMLFGGMGVMLSVVLRRRADEHLRSLTTGRILLVVYGVGGIFGILMLGLFVGRFLQGGLFPDFGQVESWLGLNFRIKDWGKLIIWSFVAGFSERLVPTLFDQLIDRVIVHEPRR